MAFTKNKMYLNAGKLNRIFASLRKIHLVDRCLILLMLVLLAQSAYVLLTKSVDSQAIHPIDIIVRTSAASIFGYLLSANFAKRNSTPTSYTTTTKSSPELVINDTNNSDTLQNRIGFTLGVNDSSLEQKALPTEEPLSDVEKPSGIGGLQIITALLIALFCLIALMFIRDFAANGNAISASATAVASQFRDFISGSVGFLIGCPTTKSTNK